MFSEPSYFAPEQRDSPGELPCPGAGCARLLASQSPLTQDVEVAPPSRDADSTNTEPLTPASLARVQYGASKEAVFVELTPYGRSELLAQAMPLGSALEVLNLRASVVRASQQVRLTGQLLRVRKSAERTATDSKAWHDQIGGEVELGLQDGGYAKVGANWPVLRLPLLQVDLSTKAVVHTRSRGGPDAYVAMDIFEQRKAWRLSAEIPTAISRTKIRLSRAMHKDWYALVALEKAKATLALSLPL